MLNPQQRKRTARTIDTHIGNTPLMALSSPVMTAFVATTLPDWSTRRCVCAIPTTLRPPKANRLFGCPLAGDARLDIVIVTRQLNCSGCYNSAVNYRLSVVINHRYHPIGCGVSARRTRGRTSQISSVHPCSPTS